MTKLTSEQIQAAEAALTKGDRIELIPIGNGGVRLVRVRRETVRAAP